MIGPVAVGTPGRSAYSVLLTSMTRWFGGCSVPAGSSSSSTAAAGTYARTLLTAETLEKKEYRLSRDRLSAMLLSILVMCVATSLSCMLPRQKRKQWSMCISQACLHVLDWSIATTA